MFQKVSSCTIMMLCALGVICQAVIFDYISNGIVTKPKWYSVHTQCHIKCPSCPKLRGENYFTYKTDPNYKRLNEENCILNNWHISHFVLHFFIGFFTQNILLSLAGGIGVELYEYWRYDCHDILDIIYNTLGALMGIALRKFL